MIRNKSSRGGKMSGANFGGGLFSEATCDPIVRHSQAPPHHNQEPIKVLVCRLPVCEGKIHKLGKTNIICHTYSATKKNGFFRRRCSRCSLWATPSKLFCASKKPQNKRFVLFHKILHPALPDWFVCLCRFHFFASRFPPSDTLAATSRNGNAGIHQPVSPRGDRRRPDCSARPQTLERVDPTRTCAHLFLWVTYL